MCLCLLPACQTQRADFAPAHTPPLRNDVVVSAPLSPAGREQADALTAYAYGAAAARDEDHEAAIEWFKQSLTADPEHAKTHLRIALSLIKLDRGEEAVALLQDYVTRNPDQPDPFVWLGSAQRHIGEDEAALQSFRTALRLAPTDEALYVQLTDLLVELGRWEEVIALLSEGTRRADNPYSLYLLLGELHQQMAGISVTEEQRMAKTEAAIAVYREAIERFPKKQNLHATLAQIYLRAGQVDAALPLLQQSAALDDTNVRVRASLASLYELQGNLEQAAAVLEEVADLQPTSPMVFMELGGLYETLGDKERAILNYELATKIGRSNPAPYIKLAILYLETEPDRAIRILEEGLELMPGNPRLLEMLGYSLFTGDQFEQALTAFRESAAMRLDREIDTPLTANFHLYTALCHFYLEQTDAAAVQLSEARTANDNAVASFLQLAYSSDIERIDERLLAVLDLLQTESPDDVALYKARGVLFAFQEDYAAAQQALAEAERLAAGVEDEQLDAMFYFWYAAAHERQGLIEQATDLFMMALEKRPEYPEAFNYLAYMWAENGIRLDEAMVYVAKALAAEPDNPAYIDTLGWVLYKQGDYEAAYEHLKRAAELMPEDPTILDHLGDVYDKLGQPEEARAAWLAAYAADPELKGLADKLTARGIALPPETAPAALPAADTQDEISDEPKAAVDVELPSEDALIQPATDQPAATDVASDTNPPAATVTETE
jgi:tetratricopeptide (TPR) repeat protein